MNETLKQIIKREVEKLPKDGQEAVNSLDWARITEEIGKKYLLSESEIDDLQTQTLLVLIGLKDADLYATGVENEVGFSKEDANKISEEVFQKIFTPIGNIVIDNIKKSGKDKDANAGQNLDFILSGGDYSAFVAPVSSPLLDKEGVGGGNSLITTSPFGHSSSSEEEKSNIPAKPKKMDDIKSKFTI